MDTFIAEHVQAKRKAGTAGSYSALLQSHLVPRHGKRLAETITAADIAQIHDGMRGRPYQANRLLAVVGSMYGFAARRGLVARGTNPALGLERYRETSRERYLTTDELRRLGDSLRLAETTGLPWVGDPDKPASKHLPKAESRRTLLAPEVTLAIRLLLFTGARLREVLHLEWRYVDMERGLLLLPDSKTGRKTIVLSALCVALLRGAACRALRDPGRRPRGASGRSQKAVGGDPASCWA